jgi:hypothetical protein
MIEKELQTKSIVNNTETNNNDDNNKRNQPNNVTCNQQ